MGKEKVLIFLILTVFLSYSVSAACPIGEGYLGNKELNSCVRISQTCATCTYVNISSITVSISNETLISNIEMENFGNGEWIYDFCNTSQFGNYYIVGLGDLDGSDSSFKSCFDIGQNLSSGESILYTVFIMVLLGFLFVMFYFIIIIPKGNEKNERGVSIKIVKMKYIRVLLIAVAYATIILILNLVNGLAVQFATLTIFAGIIGFLFEIMLRAAWVFTIILILWIFYMLIHDSNVKRNIERLGRFRVNG